MRIRMVASCLGFMAGVVLATPAAQAETINTHTNINLAQINQKNILAFDPFMSRLQEAVKAKQEAKKTPEQIRYEQALAKWKTKQAHLWTKLPAGKFTINASAYTAAADECGKSDGITASGIKVEEKRTLACPSSYPFGAKIAIEGMGVYTCEDRGGAIKGNHFDIYMETKKQAFAFGRQRLIAEVVVE